MKNVFLFSCITSILMSCSSDNSLSVNESGEPSVGLIEISNLTYNSASVAVSVFGQGVTDKGVIWSQSNDLTIDNGNSESSGANAADFSATISDLITQEQYYVRAYATYNDGSIQYSEVVPFETLDVCNGGLIYQGDNIKLETQAEVDAFGAMRYCALDAYIQIGTVFVDEDRITDISPLFSLKRVKGIIINNTLISNLNPLDNLVTSDAISLFTNENLENIEALSNINTPVNNIRIESHPKLQNINGLRNITAKRGRVEFLLIANNNILTNIDGLQGIKEWKDGSISVRDNPMLLNIDGFSNLTTFENGDLKIENNAALTNIDGLQNLTTAGTISIRIQYNENLQNINGLSNLTVGKTYELQLAGLPKITNLNALSGLSSISYFSLRDNNLLSDISGLSQVSFNSSIEVVNNPSLSSLNGLQNIEDDLFLFKSQSNSSLSNFCSLQKAFETIKINKYQVFDNAYNPTQQDIIDGNCSE